MSIGQSGLHRLPHTHLPHRLKRATFGIGQPGKTARQHLLGIEPLQTGPQQLQPALLTHALRQASGCQSLRQSLQALLPQAQRLRQRLIPSLCQRVQAPTVPVQLLRRPGQAHPQSVQALRLPVECLLQALSQQGVQLLQMLQADAAFGRHQLGRGGRRRRTQIGRQVAQVKSVSWPTPQTTGKADAATARTRASSLKAHRSSSEPPPRHSRSTSTSARALASARARCRDAGASLPCTGDG
jgi:hypothetical protein